MKILGIDPGNFGTKTSEEIWYPSQIKKVVDLADKENSNYVKFNGKDFVIGEGKFETDNRKMDKEMYLVNILTAAARSCQDENNFKIVTGLPSCHYNEPNVKAIKDKFKEKIFNIFVNGKERVLTIENIAVYSENAAPYFNFTVEEKNNFGTDDLIIINCGGGNTNIAHYKVINNIRKLVKQKTVMSGILNIYRDIADLINGSNPTNFEVEDIENILRNGYKKFNKKVDLTELIEPAFNITLNKIYQDLNNFPYENAKVILTGGGLVYLKEHLIKKIPHLEVQNNNLYATAVGFKKVGDKIWGNK